MPNHPLADRTGSVWEHRKIVYDRLGDTLPPCELCDKPLTWETAHIDHIDEDPSNNDPKNLRPLCRGCNVSRPIHANSIMLTACGETKCISAWARDPRVSVCAATIAKRRAAGASDADALFGEKVTHNGKQPAPPPPPKPKHYRSNAVALTIDGVTKTSAEWSREPGCTVSDGAIRMRFRLGWDHRRAVFEPAKRPGNRTAHGNRNALGQFEPRSQP